MKTFQLGDKIRIAAVFYDTTGVVINPGVVKVKYEAVALATSTILTYLTDAALVKDSTGTFHVDLDTSASSGIWNWRFYSTGAAQAAEQGSFFVTPAPHLF